MKLIFILCLLAGGVGAGHAQSPAPRAVDSYFPPPDSLGGWRTLTGAGEIRRQAGMDKALLDSAFAFVRGTTANGGLLVLRHGYLVYERYFGKGQREATPNLGSCGKPFTSMAVGILMHEHPEWFPQGLDQKIFTPAYLPAEAFPLPDPRMADIKLGQLLSFTAGIRGNNPVYVHGKPARVEPVGPDGWYAVTDRYALGIEDGKMGKVPFTTKTLWCPPGEGYAYSTASMHIASIMLRHLSGMELQDYVRLHLAGPLGWGRWGYGYRNAPLVTHTPGGGGIALRSTDMLRFGYLLLHDGRWQGRQLIPAAYVRAATTASPYNPHYPYSFQFNVNTHGEAEALPRDAYWKVGSGGHCLYVVPTLDLVVWKLGGRDGQYSSANTGLPEPPPLRRAEKPAPAVPYTGDVYVRTLEMVIQAIVRSGAPAGALEGQIMADPRRPDKLVYNRDDDGDGQPDPCFICGPGDPEGFLYRGRRNADGTRSGDQMSMIRKLEQYGGNSIYMTAVRTHGGDAAGDHRKTPAVYPDVLQDPWIDGDPRKGLHEALLAQWEQWFTEMDKHGIVMYFFIYDDGIDVTKEFGWSLDGQGRLAPGEKAFVQALVNRFKHHKHLIWCVMEEGQEIGGDWRRHISGVAAAIREADEYGHVIASHQLAGNVFFHPQDPVIGQFAVQTEETEVNTTADLHAWLLTARAHSGGHCSLMMAEDAIQGNRSVPHADRAEIRQRNWTAAMAGAYSLVLGMDIAHTPPAWLSDCRHIQDFFERTAFNRMQPHDELAGGETRYLLAEKGRAYVLYANHARHPLGIRSLPAGTYALTWMDCVDGHTRVMAHTALAAGAHLWTKPRGFGDEVVLYIQRVAEGPAGS